MLACAVALVLLMDVSGSVSKSNYELQRDGTANALRSEKVQGAIRRMGDVAVTVIEWSGRQKTTLPWVVIHNREDLMKVADDIQKTQRSSSGMTNMGNALMSAVSALDKVPCQAGKLVVDISGDGESNAEESSLDYRTSQTEGVSPQEWIDPKLIIGFDHAHQIAENKGIQINGLPIITPAEPTVAEWYREHVPTPDGFIIETHGFETFQQALIRKLVLEIAFSENQKHKET